MPRGLPRHLHRPVAFMLTLNITAPAVAAYLIHDDVTGMEACTASDEARRVVCNQESIVRSFDIFKVFT